jgi:hypothetical protein
MAGRHRRQSPSVADFNLQRVVDSARKDASSPETADGYRRGASVRVGEPSL